MARLPLVPALVLPLLAGLPAAAVAQDESPPQEKYGLRVEYREYRPTATGDLMLSAPGEEGTLLDIVDDLGIEDERTFDARAIFKIKTEAQAPGGYMPIDYTGDQDAPRNFTFKNTTYFRDDRVVTTMKGALWSGDYEYEFYQGPHGYVGALLGARILDVDIVAGGRGYGQRETDSGVSPLPVIGIEGRALRGEGQPGGRVRRPERGQPGPRTTSSRHPRGSTSPTGWPSRAATGSSRPRSRRSRTSFKLRMSGWQFGLELSL